MGSAGEGSEGGRRHPCQHRHLLCRRSFAHATTHATTHTHTAHRTPNHTHKLDFADFGAADIAALKASAPLVAPLVPVIVDAVYTKLFAFDVTKKIFLKRNEGFAGSMAASLEALDDKKDEQIKYRKDMLSKYLVKLVTADYDDKFVAYLDWVCVLCGVCGLMCGVCGGVGVF